MKKILLALALAAGLTSFAGSAKADINYSFTPSFTQGSGFGSTVTGTIFGSFNNNGSSFDLTSISAKSGDYSTILNVTDADTTKLNTLTQIGGVISGMARIGTLNINNNNRAGGPDIMVDFTGVSYWGWTFVNNSYQPIFNDTTRAGNFSSVATVVTGADTAAVPEPSQVAASLLLAAGIAGFVIVKRRKEASELEVLAA